MKTITIEIPEGKRAEWVDNVLTLVDEQPVEFKFKVGDKVKIKGVNQVQTVTLIALYNGTPVYKTDGNSTLTEEQIELYTEPKDITERIKTFEDACQWCYKNGKEYLVSNYEGFAITYSASHIASADILAYLKLRIITCALNEGWKPTFEDDEQYRYYPLFDVNMEFLRSAKGIYVGGATSYKLYFKTAKLAEYAATQFKDIYMDFCYKGKE